MFGLGKRLSKEEQLLAIVDFAADRVLATISGADAVSLGAYFASQVARATGREDEATQNHRTEKLRQWALDRFGQTNTVSLIWSTSYHAAIVAFTTPGEWDARVPFFEARQDQFPWEYSADVLMEVAGEIQEEVDEHIRGFYRKWGYD